MLVLPSVGHQVLFVCTTWRQTAIVPWVSKSVRKLLDVKNPNFAKNDSVYIAIYTILFACDPKGTFYVL